MANIKINGLNKYYGSVQALFDINLNIKDGEFVVFVGPSGCGKSTLLRTLAGLENADAGNIEIDGIDVTNAEPVDRNLAMVFQSYALYPHMTVRENLEFGMKVNGYNKDLRNKRTSEAVRILQLEDYLDRKPSQLSGGQRQRVAIGRAIVKNPKVFLFDEPLSNLDAKLRVQMRVELENLHKHLNATMVYVTHDQVEAMTMANKIVVLNDGRIEQVGHPMELYNQPNSKFVAEFIGSPAMNTFNSKLKFRNFNPHANSIHIGCRPEHIEIKKAGTGIIDAQVKVKEHLGGETLLYLEIQDGNEIVVKVSGEDNTPVGHTVGLNISKGKLYEFDDAGRNINS